MLIECDCYVVATSSYILYLPESDVSSTFTVCGRLCKCLLIQLCRDGLGLWSNLLRGTGGVANTKFYKINYCKKVNKCVVQYNYFFPLIKFTGSKDLPCWIALWLDGTRGLWGHDLLSILKGEDMSKFFMLLRVCATSFVELLSNPLFV